MQRDSASVTDDDGPALVAERAPAAGEGLAAPGAAGKVMRGRLGPAFWRVWSANLASCAGDGIRIGALPLLAASLDFAPGAVAAVWFAGGLPFVLVGPFSGVLSDRWRDRRLVMWTSDAVATAGGLAFALLVATGHASIAVLVAFNFIVGSISTLRDNAAIAIIPEIVRGEQLDKANSRIEAVQLLTIDLLGPPLGALLFALPRGLPFFVDAASFAVAGILVFGVPRAATRGPARPGTASPRGALPGLGMLAEIRFGFGWLLRHQVLLSVCLLVGASTLAVMSAMSVAVIYALRVLHVGRPGYVLMLAVIALGAVLGSLAAPWLVARLGRAGVLRAAFVTSPLAFLAAALTSSAVVATSALMLVGAAVGLCNVISVSLRQVLVPADLLGRVNSAYRLVAVGMGPVGSACGGLAGELLGLRAPLFASAIASGCGLVLALLFVSARTIDDSVAAMERAGRPVGAIPD
jgi:MFS family permease